MSDFITSKVRHRLVKLARRAGDAILDVYGSPDFDVEIKEDNSPLTRADQASHDVLTALEDYLDLPLLSEEGDMPPVEERTSWPAHWLIDPLDGTKEFIKRNGEFTVNIALIENHETVFGVVHVPVSGATFAGGKAFGAWRIDGENAQPIGVAAEPSGPVRVVASRSHMSDETQAYIDALGPTDVISAGSSLKFCRVADGSADVYPRLGPTMEWDTAAAQAVVEGAGGQVLVGDAPLRYNRDDMLNPHFLVAAPWLLEAHPARVGA